MCISMCVYIYIYDYIYIYIYIHIVTYLPLRGGARHAPGRAHVAGEDVRERLSVATTIS